MLKNLFILFISFSFAMTGNTQTNDKDYQAIARLDYYSGEEAGEIAVFIPDGKMDLNIKIDLVFEFHFINRGYPMVPRGVSTVPFPMELLREGDNEITVSFYENEKWVDSRKVNIKIRKKQLNEIKVDRASGYLMAGGIPFFPAGISGQWPANQEFLEETAWQGFNMVMSTWKPGKKDIKERSRFMDRCAGSGLKAIYDLSGLVENGGFGKNPAKRLELLKKEIAQYKDHPALMSWKLPGPGIIPADSLAVYFNLIKETDPWHPVSMSFSSPQQALEYMGVTDILMISQEFKPDDLSAYVKSLKFQEDFTMLKNPVWFAPESLAREGETDFLPDLKEVRALAYLNIIYHTSGFLYPFDEGYDRSPKSYATRAECSFMTLEMNELLPYLSSGQATPEIISSHESIFTRVLNLHGIFTVLAVNTSRQPMEVTLTFPEINMDADAEVLFENRKVSITHGVITDIIDGLGTRVYRLDAR